MCVSLHNKEAAEEAAKEAATEEAAAEEATEEVTEDAEAGNAPKLNAWGRFCYAKWSTFPSLQLFPFFNNTDSPAPSVVNLIACRLLGLVICVLEY